MGRTISKHAKFRSVAGPCHVVSIVTIVSASFEVKKVALAQTGLKKNIKKKDIAAPPACALCP